MALCLGIFLATGIAVLALTAPRPVEHPASPSETRQEPAEPPPSLAAVVEAEPPVQPPSEPPVEPPPEPARPIAPTPTPIPTRVPAVVTATRIAQGGGLYEVIAAYFPEQPAFAWNVVMCESRANPAINTGNGYYGMWQFNLQTWQSVGGSGLPSNASAEEQTRLARVLYNMRGWAPWPWTRNVPMKWCT